MNAVLASSAARPLTGATAPARRTGVASARAVAPIRGGRMATVRSATLNLARTADDLKAASSMTAAARSFKRATEVHPLTRASHRCVQLRTRVARTRLDSHDTNEAPPHQHPM
jgi:hypothetical protein